jgi:hypothetical protein
LVDVKRLLTRARVYANKGMLSSRVVSDKIQHGLRYTDLSFNGLTMNGATALFRKLSLGDSRVYGTEAFKDLLESGREPVVRFYLGQEEGVTSAYGGLEVALCEKGGVNIGGEGNTWSRMKEKVVPGVCFS